MRAADLRPHHTLEELETAYKSAHRPVERSRWQIIWLRKKGKNVAAIIDHTGYSRTTISILIRAYNERGGDALLDHRQFNHSEPALNDEQQEALFSVLNDTDSTVDWTSKKVRLWIERQWGIEITDVCAWGYLRRLGFTVQVPRPQHLKAATEEQRTQFIKKSSGR